MMKTLKATGDSWEAIFASEVRGRSALPAGSCTETGLTLHRIQNFPTTATDGMNSPISDIAWHGVNVAEALKAFPVSYRFTKNQSGTSNLIAASAGEPIWSSALDIAAASAAWDILFKYHGRPSGVFGADEYLAGLEAVRGCVICPCIQIHRDQLITLLRSELCLVVV